MKKKMSGNYVKKQNNYPFGYFYLIKTKNMTQKIDRESLKKHLANLQHELNLISALVEGTAGEGGARADISARSAGSERAEGKNRIVEGVFDGEKMIGPDGKQYAVPANYASKSKLVEGDMLKLTIRPDGSFLFKQIGPIERERLVGVLVFNDQEHIFYGVAHGRSYKLLTASVTYFRGEAGDEVILLTPKGGESTWAAVENIVKKLPVKETVQKVQPLPPTTSVPAFDEEKDEFKIE